MGVFGSGIFGAGLFGSGDTSGGRGPLGEHTHLSLDPATFAWDFPALRCHLDPTPPE